MSERPTVFYMHTLDGTPALFREDKYGPALYFTGSGGLVPLCRTLRQIRREQRRAMQWAATQGGNQAEWARPGRYGYRRVRLPA